MAEITNIACRRLHPHPDNPRKELGDLTELAASIKENGIFQNLTVIPGHYLNSREYIAKCVDEGGDAAAAAAAWTPKAVWSSDDYTIIIGNRRAAAAQQAGLFEVPCVVVEMDEREQLQTMMIENMQRSDLTTYEQAQGFQLMLDLGDTVEQVASKSGFSQSTIRRRVKLLSLDRDAFRRAELRGATLSDYAELDKIESVEDKNKALEALGTQNFRRVMQEVLENQKWEHRKAEWIADLKKFAIEDPNATYQTHEHVTGYSKWNITKDVVVPEDADHVQYFYKVSSGQIDLYKTRDVAAEDAEKAKRDAAREEERMIGESFHNITELMFNLRREFVVELTPTDCKKGFPAIARYMACAADDNFDLDLTLIGNILGVDLSQEFVDSSGKDWYKILDEDGVYGTMPEKVLLALAYSSMDSSYCGYWSKDWNVERQKYVYSYRENPTLDATYEMLTALGYEISDDEQALRDGTHKISGSTAPMKRSGRIVTTARRHTQTVISAAKPVMNLAMPFRTARKMKKGLKTMNEKTMGAIPVSALERLEQSAVKLSQITFCLRHEELKAAPDAAEIHSIKSDLSRALREVITNAAACALTGGATEKASPPAGAEPKRIQRKEVPKGTAYGVLRLRCPKCGDVFGRFLREPSASVTCRCGGEVQLDNLTRYEFTCPCCDFEARGRTNLEDPEITVPCKCGNPVTMKWDRNKRMHHE